MYADQVLQVEGRNECRFVCPQGGVVESEGHIHQDLTTTKTKEIFVEDGSPGNTGGREDEVRALGAREDFPADKESESKLIGSCTIQASDWRSARTQCVDLKLETSLGGYAQSKTL